MHLNEEKKIPREWKRKVFVSVPWLVCKKNVDSFVQLSNVAIWTREKWVLRNFFFGQFFWPVEKRERAEKNSQTRENLILFCLEKKHFSVYPVCCICPTVKLLLEKDVLKAGNEINFFTRLFPPKSLLRTIPIPRI